MVIALPHWRSIEQSSGGYSYGTVQSMSVRQPLACYRNVPDVLLHGLSWRTRAGLLEADQTIELPKRKVSNGREFEPRK